jgi:hypothetical protein
MVPFAVSVRYAIKRQNSGVPILRKLLIIFNATIGALLILGFAFVAFTLYTRGNQKNPEAAATIHSLAAKDCEIVGASAANGQLFVTLGGSQACNRIEILNLKTLKSSGTITR